MQASEHDRRAEGAQKFFDGSEFEGSSQGEHRAERRIGCAAEDVGDRPLAEPSSRGKRPNAVQAPGSHEFPCPRRNQGSRLIARGIPGNVRRRRSRIHHRTTMEYYNHEIQLSEIPRGCLTLTVGSEANVYSITGVNQ